MAEKFPTFHFSYCMDLYCGSLFCLVTEGQRESGNAHDCTMISNTIIHIWYVTHSITKIMYCIIYTFF